jgi:hypothetical protein
MSHRFYDGGYMSMSLMPERSQQQVPDDGVRVNRQYVGPDFIKTMGIPLLQGRDFTIRDDETAPQAVIISASLAKQHWGMIMQSANASSSGVSMHHRNGMKWSVWSETLSPS